MTIIEAAKKVLLKLHNAQFQAFFVGGCVRNLLLNLPIEEIDIATNASPEMIKALFPNALSIGIAFGVMLIKEGLYAFEVATFRKDISYSDGRHPDQIKFSDMHEDALRRDFTINGMFYDPFNEKIYDYVGGKIDLKNKIIRAIGFPRKRFHEDKLRLIRAIRFAARFDFTLDVKTELAIIKESPTLMQSVSRERVWSELKKITQYDNIAYAFTLLYKCGLLFQMFPELAKHLTDLDIKQCLKIISKLPKSFPTILIISPFFLQLAPKQIEIIFRDFKVSNYELNLILKWKDIYFALKNYNAHKIKLTHFLASPEAPLFIPLFESFLTEDELKTFRENFSQFQADLHPHILRIIHKNPIVSAYDLIKLNIPPGRLLGEILQEAENIAIEKNINNKEEILKTLSNLGLLK